MALRYFANGIVFYVDERKVLIKANNVLIDTDGNVVWAIAEDFKVLCKAYEWNPSSE